jgi:hypothetical protein
MTNYAIIALVLILALAVFTGFWAYRDQDGPEQD